MKHLERTFQGRNGIGWYFLMVVLIIAVLFFASIPLSLAIIPFILSHGGNIGDISAALQNPTEYGIPSNISLMIMMATFVILFFTFFFLIKPLHQRSLVETINGRRKIRWDRVRIGIIVWGIIFLADVAIGLLTASPGEYEFRFNARAFFPLVLIILVMMPFQTSIEEIFFRGYLAQGVGRWTKSRWWALIIPSILFAMIHLANPEVKEYGLLLSAPLYLIMGLTLGLISILDDGIELALGFHFINNALSAVLVTHKASALQTDALILLHKHDPVASLISTTIACVLLIFILQRIYRWDFGILNRKVKPELPPAPIEQAGDTEFTTP